jgi:hypothetical protein
VGKTTLLGEIESRWGDHATYLACDVPEALLPGWWDRQWSRARQMASASNGAVLLLDEIHALPRWNLLLKVEADRLRRDKVPLHVVVSGSSALRLGAGSRESMAGRFELLRLLHWPASELVARLGVPTADAARLTVTHGGYPGAVPLRNDPRRFQRYLLDSIIEPAIGRDLAVLDSVRKPAMLRQVFAVAVGHPSQVVSLQKLQGALLDKGALETVAHYLRVLEDACLVAGVAKYALGAVRQRAAPPKLVALNNALLVAGGQASAPDPVRQPEQWGRHVENACIAFAWNCGQSVSYWREEPYEVDFIIEGTWGRFAVEVKTGRYGTRDLAGLLEFHRRHPGIAPLVLCDAGEESIAERLAVATMPWERFLLDGLPG